MHKLVAILILVLGTLPSFAQDKAFTLAAPAELQDTGLLRHMLPRFSLKTGIRITLSDEAADARFGAEGRPAFRQGDTVWHLDAGDSAATEAFEKWLFSDVGKRTIETFAPEGTPLFTTDVAAVRVARANPLSGDAQLGEKISLKKCGRCHVVSEENRMNAIGSTPSFALMRTFVDWQARFEGFFLLKPHPAFTQVDGVTDPFPENRPSPIAPIEVTLDEIDAITAYVASVPPADLGAPVQSQ